LSSSLFCLPNQPHCHHQIWVSDSLRHHFLFDLVCTLWLSHQIDPVTETYTILPPHNNQIFPNINFSLSPSLYPISYVIIVHTSKSSSPSSCVNSGLLTTVRRSSRPSQFVTIGCLPNRNLSLYLFRVNLFNILGFTRKIIFTHNVENLTQIFS